MKAGTKGLKVRTSLDSVHEEDDTSLKDVTPDTLPVEPLGNVNKCPARSRPNPFLAAASFGHGCDPDEEEEEDEYDDADDDEDSEDDGDNFYRTTKVGKPYCLLSYGPRGEAELIRLVFALVGQPYEDRTVPEEELEELIQTTPYKSLPVLVKGDHRWGRGDAIARMLARKYCGMGETNHEHLVVEATFERLCRLKRNHDKVMQLISQEIKQRDKLEWVIHQLRYVILPPAMAEWDKLILSSRGPFIVSSGISLADVAIMDFLDQVTAKIPLDDLLLDLYALSDLIMLVKQHRPISHYLEERGELD